MEPNKPITNEINTSAKSDEIFVVKPEPKKPLDKKFFWLTVGLTAMGIVVLIIVFVVAVIGTASGLADNYKGLAYAQIKKLDAPIKDLEPATVLNNRNIDASQNKIYVSKQSQPSLENTLFVGGWSARYVKAEKLQAQLKAHYSALDDYSSQLDKLLAFDDELSLIMQQESTLLGRIKTNTPSNLRTLSGSYDDLATQVKALDALSQLTDLQATLTKTYSDRADAYTQWALAVEAKNKVKIKSLQTDIKALKNEATGLVGDKNYIALFTPTYQNLLHDQKALESELSN